MGYLIGSGGGGGGAPATPKAATFVVDASGGDFTTIAAAIAALPAEGGLILLREGTYTIPSTITVPVKPIVIRGCGNGLSGGFGTMIDVTGLATPMFSLAAGASFPTYFTLEDLRINAPSVTAGSELATMLGAGWEVWLNRVHVNNVDVLMDGVAPTLRMVASVANVNRIVVPTSGTGGFRTTDSTCNILSSALTALGNAVGPLTVAIFMENSFINAVVDFFGIEAGVSKFTQVGLVGVRMNMRGGSSTVQGCRIFGDAANTAASIVVLQDRIVIDGNMFETGQAGVEIQGRTDTILSNNVFRDLSVVPWKETSGANRNRFEGNNISNNLLPTIIGADSIWDGGNIRTLTAGAHTLDERHRTIEGNATGGVVTLNLPLAASAKHRIYTAKKIDASANLVTFDGSGAETIDGAATASAAAQNDALTVQSNGTSWSIISRNP